MISAKVPNCSHESGNPGANGSFVWFSSGKLGPHCTHHIHRLTLGHTEYIFLHAQRRHTHAHKSHSEPQHHLSVTSMRCRRHLHNSGRPLNKATTMHTSCCNPD